jgi:putative transposase
MQTLTYRFRLRDKHNSDLSQQAKAVNWVWNYCGEAQQHAIKHNKKWLSGYDLVNLTSGTTKEGLDLHAHTIQRVCLQYAQSRQQHKKAVLRFRGRKSLGWVPFNTDTVKFDGKFFVFRGVRYEPMQTREGLIPGMRFGAGSFSQDSKGHWYLNVPVEVECANAAPNIKVGIDLGLNDLATLSDGIKIQAPRFYRQSEQVLVQAQRLKKPKRVKLIHKKIANRRKDFLHKATKNIASSYGYIAVGDVSSSKLSQTNMAKSVYDASWYSFKQMLAYKAIMHGGRMDEVNEKYSSQTCSNCGSRTSNSKPRGIGGLGIREWTCSHCGALHDRDQNAAKNILARGLASLVEGSPGFSRGAQSRTNNSES